MNQTIEPRLLRGFRDYLPAEMIPRQQMITRITEVFECYGFAPLQTPALEYADILVGKYGDDAEKLLYRFADNGGRDVCLRYDLTVPLARLAAQYQDLPRPIKRYQVAPVWRAEKPGRGRYREFFQCDIDIVGSASLLADAECVAVDAAVMRALAVPGAQIRINNRKVLNGLAQLLDVDAEERMNAVFRTIDKLPSAGPDAVRELLVKECGLSTDAVDRVFAFLDAQGSNEEIIAQLREMFAGIDIAAQGLAELEQVVEAATAMGVDRDTLVLDPSIARGLDYYTGTVFETFITELPGFGSVMSGGRYDTLITRFLGKEVPAVGISVGIDRLFAAMLELDLVQKKQSLAQVMVATLDEDCLDYALRVATVLRTAGVRTEFFFYQGEKAKKQFKYSATREIPLVAVIGGSEKEQAQVTLKDMRKGEQESVALEAVVERVQQLLAQPAT